MTPKPLVLAQEKVLEMQDLGCQFIVNGDNLTIADPNKILQERPELLAFVKQEKIAVLSFIQRQALRRLLQVLEMSQPEVPLGVMDDYISALTQAGIVIGNIWED
jgi:hypothetical protein